MMVYGRGKRQARIIERCCDSNASFTAKIEAFIEHEDVYNIISITPYGRQNEDLLIVYEDIHEQNENMKTRLGL